MSLLAQESFPAPAKTERSRTIALFYAAILIVMAVGQLYAFEKFIPLVESFWLPGGHGTATLLAGVIVMAEVLAVPFLLRMSLSPLMRIFSMVMGWIVPAVWLYIAVWLNVTTNAVNNIGLFGTKVPLMVGWWAVFFTIALAILAAWASWGMWPTLHKKATIKHAIKKHLVKK